ncbi:ABC transporter ATP-binding protein [Phycisphaerae bacterium]|jgi:putative ABC transport system ATP-binding protein|nr:ABC transporter ATP-binding protein [Phycisphaerae bacterium]
MLTVSNVHKSYTTGDRVVQALRGASLSIAEPGFYAIMGQSGSGKSTLLHLLGALDKPDSGEIVIAGKTIHAMDDKAATAFRRTGLGIVFQQFNLIPTLTARENIELPGLLAGDRAEKLHKRSSDLLEKLGISARAEHRPDALSGGEQQRVAIARALLYSPPILLADEPTGNLDSASSAKLWTLLADIAKEQRMLVVMVTHEPAAAVYCKRIFVIRDGIVNDTIDTEGLDASGVAARYQQSVRAA